MSSTLQVNKTGKDYNITLHGVLLFALFPEFPHKIRSNEHSRFFEYKGDTAIKLVDKVVAGVKARYRKDLKHAVF